jgi:plastocyanin
MKKLVNIAAALIVSVLVIYSATYITLWPISTSTADRVTVIIVRGSGTNVTLGFHPKNITVVLGINSTIAWINEDNTWHTVHSNFPEFDSKIIAPTGSFTHAFNRTGFYPYHCDPHPWMTGIIEVKRAGAQMIVNADALPDGANPAGLFGSNCTYDALIRKLLTLLLRVR